MEHSPVMKVVMMVSWVLTSVSSINMLTSMYDYNLILYLGTMMPALVIPLLWLIGLSGLFSFGLLVKTVAMGCGSCGSCPCKCGDCKCS